MTTAQATKKLENKGYKVTFSMSSTLVMATKNQRTYKANGVNELVKKILG